MKRILYFFMVTSPCSEPVFSILYFFLLLPVPPINTFGFISRAISTPKCFSNNLYFHVLSTKGLLINVLRNARYRASWGRKLRLLTEYLSSTNKQFNQLSNVRFMFFFRSPGVKETLRESAVGHRHLE